MKLLLACALVVLALTSSVAAFGQKKLELEMPPKKAVVVPKKTAVASYDLGMYVAAHPELTDTILHSIWDHIKCKICEHAIGHMVSFVADHGCDLADPVAAAACAVAGPCEPLCAAALIEGCSIIVEDVIKKHVTDHHDICKDIHMC
jgi:predicted small lipoprotein YifL